MLLRLSSPAMVALLVGGFAAFAWLLRFVIRHQRALSPDGKPEA